MEDKRVKALKKYIKPSYGGILLSVSLTIIGIAGLVGTFIDTNSESKDFWIAGIFILFALFLGELSFRELKEIKKFFTDIEESGGLPFLLEDFETGGKAFKDKLILGKRFLIGKNTGIVIAYGDITQIYQEIHKTNSIEDSRSLKIRTAKTNKLYDLCKIPLRGKAEDEVIQVLEYIYSMNPNIKVGYK